MPCTHYITIAIVCILYCCLLSFYRDATVSLYHESVDVMLQHPCTRIRHMTEVPICTLKYCSFMHF